MIVKIYNRDVPGVPSAPPGAAAVIGDVMSTRLVNTTNFVFATVRNRDGSPEYHQLFFENDYCLHVAIPCEIYVENDDGKTIHKLV